jgi:type I restriction enzyme, R subunit
MATGAGKTFLACTFLYRLIKHAKVRRVLFLVDRTNLGDQTLRELQDYVPPDANRRFTDLYVTQHLRSNRLDPDAKIVITTIQRLFSMLKGEDLAPEAEEHSAFEDGFDAPPKPVAYNPAIPIETFDIIVTDECHRSIYGQWRQVLDYFDATVIGLTATPSLHTLGFFGRNLVAEYPYERSVIDGVNVAFEVFRIKTEIGEQGGLIEAGFEVPVQDKKTRARRYQELDAALDYAASQLDRSVTSENQIRTVLEAYKTSLPTQLFPDREEVPKTLIFAKDDNHAENITRIAREAFGRGNDFAKKITYQTSEDPKALLKLFRIARLPRIVVTVDMIATGTDVKPIEVLIFMRDVRSELYFEQMKGRGVRSIDKDKLLDVTPDAKTGKERFVIVDAVGVTESRKTTMQPLERQRHVGFKKLLEHVASGDRRDDTLTTLAARLTSLGQKIEPEDRARIRTLTGGLDLHEIATCLMQATEAEALGEAAADPASPAARERERAVKDIAAKPIADNPALRQLLTDLKTRSEIIIDEISPDAVVSKGFDLARAGETTERFTDFLEQHKDELTALQILYSRPAASAHLTYDALAELRRALLQPPWVLDTVTVWEAYRRLDETRVRGRPMKDVLTELIALVRFATGPADGVLESYALQVERRFNLWLGRQQKAGRTFTDEQQRWLHLIKRFVAHNAEITPRDLMEVSSFTSEGGLAKANTVFGRDQLRPILDELTEALVA